MGKNNTTPKATVETPTESLPTPKESNTYTFQDGERRKQELFREYSKEQTVPRNMSPMYQPYFGAVMTCSINGITIFFPLDGKTHYVPKSFATLIDERRMKIDALLNKQAKMADISANAESSPGELKLL